MFVPTIQWEQNPEGTIARQLAVTTKETSYLSLSATFALKGQRNARKTGKAPPPPTLHICIHGNDTAE